MKKRNKDNSLEEELGESIVDSIGDINDWLYELDVDM